MKAAARVAREKKTVKAMVAIYCRDHHGHRNGLCAECGELLSYAHKRVDQCPLIEDKPTCAKCAIHCYEKTRRERIRIVMRYAGPRMLPRHPILTILHLSDGHRKTRKRSH